MMSQRQSDEEREERIIMEIVVDTYGPEEQAMGWYSYLDERGHLNQNLRFWLHWGFKSVGFGRQPPSFVAQEVGKANERILP